MERKENIKKNNGKYVIQNKKKFFTVIAIFCIIIVLALILIFGNKKIKIDENTNLSTLNAKKYSTQIKEQYEQDGKKDKFVEDYYNVQNGVGMYILNNSTLEENSFTDLLTTLNNELKSEEWPKIGIQKPNTWNGSWSVDENGNVKFKFASKELEPSWIKDTQVNSLVILN